MNPDDSLLKTAIPDSKLGAFGYSLTTPHVKSADPEDYYQSRLLLSLILLLGGVNAAYLLEFLIFSPVSNPLLAIYGLSLLAKLLAYRLTKNGGYHQAVRGLIGVYILIVFGTIAFGLANLRYFTILYLIFPMLLTSFFLSRRATLGMVGIVILVVSSMDFFLTGTAPIYYFQAVTVVASISVMLVLNAHFQEKIHTTQKLRITHSEKYYRTIIETALEGIRIIDAVGVITFVNASFAAMLGYTQEEMIGQNFKKFIVPDQWEKADSSLAERRQGISAANINIVLRHRLGNPVWVQATSQPMYDDAGQFTGVLSFFSDVTQQHFMENAVRENEMRYGTMVSALAEGVVILDDTGKVVACNASAERILRRPAGSAIGQPLLDSAWMTVRKDGTDFPHAEHPFSVTLRTGEPQRHVVMGIRRPDSSYIWLSMNTQRMEYDPEMPPQVMVSFADITTITDMQERLYQRNKELMTVQAIAAALTKTLDPDEVLEMVVTRATGLVQTHGCVLYDLGGNEVRAIAAHGMSDWVATELANPPDHPFHAFLAQVEESYQTRVGQSLYYAQQKYLAEYGILSFLVVPVIYQGDRLGVAMLVDQRPDHRYSQWDVSLIEMLMHHAASAIHNARLFHKLVESEERYRLLVELSQEAIIVGVRRKIVYANPSALAMLGVPTLEAVQQYSMLDFVHPEDLERVMGFTQQLYFQRQLVPLQEFKLQRLDKSSFYAETAAIPIVYQGQQAVLTVTRDITERKNAERIRLDSSLQTERIRLLHAFISDISHDLKTPLAVMKLKTYLVEKTPDPTKRQSHIQDMIQQIDRLENLITSLITMSKLDATPNFVMKTSSLNRLVKAVVESVHSLAEEQQHEFQLVLEETLPDIWADEEELQRALGNIIQNAVRYTPPGGKIIVRTKANPQGTICEVQDTGIGIPLEAQSHIFDRFYRVESARTSHTGGAGLGLAIAKAIIAQHGGQIELESQEGQGSCFRVILPINSTA